MTDALTNSLYAAAAKNQPKKSRAAVDLLEPLGSVTPVLFSAEISRDQFPRT